MPKIFDSTLTAHRLIPVVTVSTAAHALPLADALIRGGLPLCEVTLRTGCAIEAISQIARAYPDMLLGAGTVLDAENVTAAADAGARFVVSPGFSYTVAERCAELGLPYLPGVATASELMAAMDAGFRLLKFFPAEQLGGVAYLRALAAPFGTVRFVPTGGITEENLPAYLAIPQVAACGGSFVAPERLMAAGSWDEIARRAQDAAERSHT